jgi:Pin2-interacting protein X1
LDVFKDLLGRLNGKSEEVIKKEGQLRTEIKTNLYIERKFGPMRFISGGLLHGDQMLPAELVDDKPTSIRIKVEDESTFEEATLVKSVLAKKLKKEKKSKKRKAEESEDTDTSDSRSEKKRKKSSKAERSGSDDAEVEELTRKKRKDKKEKREKKSKRSEKEPELVEFEKKSKKSKKSKDAPQPDSLPDISTETSKDAASEKVRKKEKKRDKKLKKADSTEPSVVTATISSSTTTLALASQDSGSSTPLSTGASTPQVLSARHRARSRNIASKKLAYDDIQAMNQVYGPFVLFMVGES